MNSNTRLTPTAPSQESTIPRVVTAAVGIPLLVLIVWTGLPWFAILVAAVTAVAVLELCGMARQWEDRPVSPLAAAISVALIVASYLYTRASTPPTKLLPLASIGAAVSLVWLLSRSPNTRSSSTWTATVAAAVYVGGLLFHAPVLRAIDDGKEWVFFLLLATFATDSFAFLVGRTVGKRVLAPSISPSKTWEGAVGGILATAGAAVAGAQAWTLGIGLWQAVGLGALIGVVGQLGDLIESRLKRTADVKDSGWLLPGHGGTLDRLDSIVLNLVVVYYFVS